MFFYGRLSAFVIFDLIDINQTFLIINLLMRMVMVNILVSIIFFIFCGNFLKEIKPGNIWASHGCIPRFANEIPDEWGVWLLRYAAVKRERSNPVAGCVTYGQLYSCSPRFTCVANFCLELTAPLTFCRDSLSFTSIRWFIFCPLLKYLAFVHATLSDFLQLPCCLVQPLFQTI